MTKIISIGILLIVLSAAGFLIYGHIAEQNFYSDCMHQLDLNYQKNSRKIFLKSDVASTPTPVNRYFRKAIKEGQVRPGFARYKENGQFKSNAGDKWVTLSAEGYYSTKPYGYLWKAEIDDSDFLSGSMSEYYLDGKGIISKNILTGTKVEEQNGLTTNELLLTRFLTRAVLFPSTLLPDTELIWEPIDNTKAKLVVYNQGNNVSVVFHFDKNFLVEKITSLDIENDSSDGVNSTFIIHFSNYRNNSGFVVPTHIEYQWMNDKENFTFGKSDISSLEFNIPKLFN